MKTNTTANQPSVVADGLMSVTEASQFLKIGRSKLYALMDSGRLPYAKIDKARRLPRAGVLKLAESCLVGAAVE